MKTIIRNTVFMNLFNIFGRASGLIRYVLLVYFLSDPGYALITFGFSAGRLCRHVMDWGLDHYITREGAREQERLSEFFWNGLALKSAWGAVFFIAAFFYLYGARGLSPYELLVVYISLTGSAMLSLAGVMRSVFAAVERMEYIFFTNAPARTVSVLLLAAALAFDAPLALAAAAVAAEPLLWLAGMAWMLGRTAPPGRPAWSQKRAWAMSVESWPLALFGFFQIVYLSLDVIMIEALLGGRDAVAPYTLASLLVEGVTLLLSGYILAAFPAFSKLHPADEAGFKRLFTRSAAIVLAMSAPLSAMLAAWPGEWMNLLRNTDPVSAQVLAILALNLNLALINTFMIAVLTARNQQRLLVALTAAGAIVAFAGNWLLIPVHEHVGAAWATLGAQAVMFVLMSAICSIQFRLRFPLIRMAGVALSAFAAAWLAKLAPLPHVLLAPPLYGLLFAALIFAFRIITIDDLRRMKAAIDRD